MDTVAINGILDEYGTSGISVVLRIIQSEEIAFDTIDPSATSKMAENLEKALVEYKEHTKG